MGNTGLIRHIYIFLPLRELQNQQEQKDINRILEQCDKYSMRMFHLSLGLSLLAYTNLKLQSKEFHHF